MSGQYKVAWLCEALLVSRSGYYDWKERRRQPGPRQLENIRFASASERNLLAVARLTAAHDWLMRWVVRDGATALPALCAWSGSSLDSAPSIERPSLIAATADPSRLTDCTTSLFDAPIKSGSAMPPQC